MGETGEPGPVGADPDVGDPDAPQRNRCAAEDRDERAAAANGVERDNAEAGCVNHRVDAAANHRADRGGKVLPPGDEVIGAQGADQCPRNLEVPA